MRVESNFSHKDQSNSCPFICVWKLLIEAKKVGAVKSFILFVTTLRAEGTCALRKNACVEGVDSITNSGHVDESPLIPSWF